MPRLKVGIVRYGSVARAISEALGIEPPPDFLIGQGRITLTFRRLGASRWPEAQQIEHALQVASVARSVLSSDSRRAVRQRADRAIVVVYEDAKLMKGCAVVSRWECVLPADPAATQDRLGS